METTPEQLKKGTIFLFLTPRQRLSFALTNKTDLAWTQPILRFMDLPVAGKIAYIQSPSRAHLTDDLIVEAFSKEKEGALLSLLSRLTDHDRNKKLKEKLRDRLEERLLDRNYKKLIKRTLLKDYIQYLMREGRSVPHFLNRITSPEVRSQAIEQFLLLARDDMTPTTLQKWVQRIPDPLTRQKTKRRL